ncbi:unnamed protein product [Chondrus crispus]|uniref:Uncharacterized protein n=1 Tax=Chondrus crispus TaxID=2769 RepID=R7QE20_CHOCR|nr:unnamed protein product [Chondrus crispus]CDF35706.1 unnamed protein product [Chondrus crispus]|eukprot:XP_005715525.1 unnamed protein product [Chondrus crispus]
MRLRTQLADQLGTGPCPADENKVPIIARVLSSPPKIKRSLSRRSLSLSRRRRRLEESAEESRLYVGLEDGVLEDEDDFVEEPATISDILPTGETPYRLGLLKCQRGVPGLVLEDDEQDAVMERRALRAMFSEAGHGSGTRRDAELAEQQPCSVRGLFQRAAYDFEGTEPSFSDMGDNPKVPEVPGLNAIATVGDDEYGFDDVDEEDEEENDEALYEQFQKHNDLIEVAEEDQRYFDEQSDHYSFDDSVFTEREVAVLLLAHDIARASKRNSALMAKCPDAPPGPLLTAATAARIEDLFKSDAIMEIASVVAVFHMLQRWTVCFPYRAEGESLEAPVRKFVQTPIAHDLSVGSVGQRSASKSSASLRRGQGRSIRLPRHTVVSF